ncbi:MULTISPECIES: exopolysaccharide biosynthesis polyprenyl glycosylphosphotransferase [unclassified Empedobacter]|uniref:exopolysaccharide biosynthesis polyprenyl glycosylphosphotransferase n=1 Tax=unclassified Empedobacter TaxID=2643773 RepID=UPI0025BFAA61|nr:MULTISPECIES: exopolysaccharide biosynthesis polyprenyl glycosylphosphotransferase [unclassified Empedobacter]
MQQRKHVKFYFFQEFIDIGTLIIFFFIFLKLQYQYFWTEDYSLERIPTFFELFKSHYKALLLFLVIWFLIAKNVSLYEVQRRIKFVDILKKIIYQILFFSVAVFAISGLKTSDLYSPQLGIAYIFALFSIGIVSRLLIFIYYRKLHLKGQNLANILIIDKNDNTNKFISLLKERSDLGIKLYEEIRNSDIYYNEFCLKIKGVDFRKYITENKINKIFISQKGEMSKELTYKIASLSELNLINVSYIPDSIYNGITELKVVYIDTLPIFEVKRFPLDLKFNQIIKNIFDIIFASLVCVFLLSWLFPIIALLIYLDSKGDILFVQKRNGLNGVEFDCYKFRTMIDTKYNSIKATERNDPRVTKIGKFLRKTSLDELPQFINVLKGDMSIVGPRPHMISQDHYYRDIINRYNIRHYVKPGITGLSQIKGYRGAIDSDEDMEKRIRTDVYYVRNWSYLLDIQIIYQTIMLVVKGDENAI